MLKNFGPMEIGIILVIVLMIFGAGKLPQVGSAVGKSLRAFKQGQSDDDVEDAPKTKKRKVIKKKTDTELPVVDKTQSA